MSPEYRKLIVSQVAFALQQYAVVLADEQDSDQFLSRFGLEYLNSFCQGLAAGTVNGVEVFLQRGRVQP